MPSNLKETSKTEINSVEAYFLKINQERIDLTRQGLSERQARFINLLALLLYENNPVLPGYINDEVPAGVTAYSPE